MTDAAKSHRCVEDDSRKRNGSGCARSFSRIENSHCYKEVTRRHPGDTPRRSSPYKVRAAIIIAAALVRIDLTLLLVEASIVAVVVVVDVWVLVTSVGVEICLTVTVMAAAVEMALVRAPEVVVESFNLFITSSTIAVLAEASGGNVISYVTTTMVVAKRRALELELVVSKVTLTHSGSTFRTEAMLSSTMAFIVSLLVKASKSASSTSISIVPEMTTMGLGSSSSPMEIPETPAARIRPSNTEANSSSAVMGHASPVGEPMT
mmetsp:Transcript_28752/g.43506  ORF Transcript_28752/g.43506 Transcript_28752/m.43506 type:complete len:263 (+) Transcript_28752:53-841(+)